MDGRLVEVDGRLVEVELNLDLAKQGNLVQHQETANIMNSYSLPNC